MMHMTELGGVMTYSVGLIEAEGTRAYLWGEVQPSASPERWVSIMKPLSIRTDQGLDDAWTQVWDEVQEYFRSYALPISAPELTADTRSAVWAGQAYMRQEGVASTPEGQAVSLMIRRDAQLKCHGIIEG